MLNISPAHREAVEKVSARGLVDADMRRELYLYVFAPVITSFMMWVLNEAKKDGVCRLYFLARDMWQCVSAANLLAKRMKDASEIRYLYVSRQSLHQEDTDAVKQYLKEQGLYDDTPWAIVDSGWLGTTQQSMAEILGKEIRGYYFGLYAIPKGIDQKTYRAWYFMPKGNIRRKIHFANSLLEAVMSAPDGTTEGYERREEASGDARSSIAAEALDNTGAVYPLLRKQPNPNASDMIEFRAILHKYVEIVTVQHAEQSPTRDLFMCEKLLSLLMGAPTKEECEAMGTLLFCENGRDESFEDVAVLWTDEEYRSHRLFRKILLKASGRKLHESAWPQASFTRHPLYKEADLYGERLYRLVMYLRMDLRSQFSALPMRRIVGKTQ